jgi:hypothetical protein
MLTGIHNYELEKTKQEEAAYLLLHGSILEKQGYFADREHTSKPQ